MSPKYKLSKDDLPAILKATGIGVAMCLASWLTEFVHQIDYGVWTPIVMGVIAPGLTALKRWLTDYTK